MHLIFLFQRHAENANCFYGIEKETVEYTYWHLTGKHPPLPGEQLALM